MTANQVQGPAIHVQGLEKSYKRLEVLRGVDFFKHWLPRCVWRGGTLCGGAPGRNRTCCLMLCGRSGGA